MSSIKASEVSEVLKSQIEGIDAKSKFEEIGTVLQVSDGVVRIYGLQNAEAGELSNFHKPSGMKAVVMNLGRQCRCCFRSYGPNRRRIHC